jgi:hypothetical protein
MNRLEPSQKAEAIVQPCAGGYSARFGKCILATRPGRLKL